MCVEFLGDDDDILCSSSESYLSFCVAPTRMDEGSETLLSFPTVSILLSYCLEGVSDVSLIRDSDECVDSLILSICCLLYLHNVSVDCARSAKILAASIVRCAMEAKNDSLLDVCSDVVWSKGVCFSCCASELSVIVDKS